jgi:hypothetical protein
MKLPMHRSSARTFFGFLERSGSGLRQGEVFANLAAYVAIQSYTGFPLMSQPDLSITAKKLPS